MVFVTVGNARQAFSRLVLAIDELCKDGFFGKELIFVQRGHTDGGSLTYCESTAFVVADEFEQYLSEASLVVCHGGTTQLAAIRHGKVPVVMPRRKRYGEHINDHQVQLVEALAAEGLVIPAYEAEELPRAIREARRRGTPPIGGSAMIELVAEALEQISARG